MFKVVYNFADSSGCFGHYQTKDEAYAAVHACLRHFHGFCEVWIEEVRNQ